MKHTISKFKNEGDKKLVGFIVESNGNTLAVDKRVDISGTDEEMVSAALVLAKPDIDEWQASFVHVGKEWDAEAGAFKAAPAAEGE
jgi:predicted HD phosphohydrolase